MKAQRGVRLTSTSQQQADAAAEDARRALVASMTPKAARAAMLKAFGAAVDAAIKAARQGEAMQDADALGWSGKGPRPTILDATQRAVLRGEATLAKLRAEEAFDICVTVTIGHDSKPHRLETPSPVAELLLACQPFRNLLATFSNAGNDREMLFENEGRLSSAEITLGDLRQLDRKAARVTQPEPPAA